MARKMISQITEFSNQLTKSSSDLGDLSSSMSEGAGNVTGKSESSFDLKYLNILGSNSGSLKLIQNCSSLRKVSVKE